MTKLKLRICIVKGNAISMFMEVKRASDVQHNDGF